VAHAAAIVSIRGKIIFLIDVDNTLLNNDKAAADLKGHLTSEVGEQKQERYWARFERLRQELNLKPA
jgi:hypothetical protein